jgi:cytosine/adenosine deaminase-related metal-dependent hydrolase
MNCHLVLGTDSYSSNWQLSIAEEIRLLHTRQKISLQFLLQMATINGATALRWQDRLGSFEKGKQPGIVLLKNDLTGVQRIL